ncbi:MULTISPECIES: ATP phosphoribosyltransferase regulatory subunit [Variovorax]|jgi:ATP phosphoribosyltransferase regulatory subunit|uniref:ATP phosphoribosyltransferase regulatory subunit n=1 Tax=Variovorax TaxID=34072 RepID=UPI00086F2752|nr:MULTISPECIES: ATP phosphoribosyltransferase regulatory subunit [Variovorax]MBN8753110.1 ATP phosphoribosyltransferase regulatory subunit [Variovorax sp.]ODU11608.1 MAG: ATP phosphoribosyltransferase regulatory subunit [Variovorax sp. SCN 67-85]ODV15027.1 MAG: ATP phosphoribosyltransferase regulatory subunit [Variovorax sp. SCN 67-20]OJZ05253.1 MAG: ATP phosphoribosyltransferase regulatory subunit [Variovorax sp. 67-131]UKI05313.1 ATP phosphoribosyltransferase regulatory subunit [Variovorax 
MSAWVLPDHIADVLPSEARHIEELRRQLLDTARGYGYELVMPPLLEHLESLLSGTGEALDLQTFKLVDQLSGRSMGLRADTTPQVARIDAHLLNRDGVARLCYCGPVLHTRPDRPHATREPLQFGAEIYGHAGLEADTETLLLALDCLDAAGLREGVIVDLADARIVRALFAGVPVDAAVLARVHAALAAKDASELASLTKDFPAASRDGLRALIGLYGDAAVLDEAAKALKDTPGVGAALADLKQLAAGLGGVAGRQISFDLADLRGYAYYSGMRFGIYVPGAADSLVRGGRYDEVGAVFGRNRPAVGFSLDVRELVGVLPARPLRAAIRAPWSDAAGLRQAIAQLRKSGETVVCVLPGHGSEIDEFHCDRELVEQAGQWSVRTI